MYLKLRSTWIENYHMLSSGQRKEVRSASSQECTKTKAKVHYVVPKLILELYQSSYEVFFKVFFFFETILL